MVFVALDGRVVKFTPPAALRADRGPAHGECWDSFQFGTALEKMLIFPAIDLKDGVCVRLKKGVMEDATVFNTDPAAQARAFAAQGFQWLHCVDLNGAFAGKSANTDAIKSIRAAIDLPIQLGGGIRDMRAVEAWLAAGITRVILGTAALTNPQFVKDAARAFPGRIVVGADARAERSQ